MNPETPEGFVDADEAAKFLFLTRRRILELARGESCPAIPSVTELGAFGASV